MSAPVKIVMVEDDHGHAKLIEKNIRRANISNEIVHFDHGQPAHFLIEVAKAVHQGVGGAHGVILSAPDREC